MMALDLSIYNALLQPGPSAFQISNALADRRTQEEDRASQRQLNALQMQKAQMEMGGLQRADQEANALRSFAGSPGFDLGTQETRAKLWQIAPGKAGAMIKDYTAQQETEAKIGKDKADAARIQLDNRLKQIGVVKNAVSAAKDQATYQQALQYLQANGVDTTGVPAQFDPAYVANMGQMAMTAEERLKADFERQRIAETQRHNKTSEGLTARGQNMTDARAREANDIQKQAARTQIVTDPNMGVLAVDKGTGTFRPVTGGDGSAIPGENKVAALKLSGQLQAGIDMARTLIPKATASGAGALVDSAAGFFGQSSSSADAAGQLETLAGWMTSNVPRMQGPQSDKDTMLYRQMAAEVGDRTKPASVRLKALDTLEALQKKYADVNGTKKPAANVVRTGKDASGRKVEQLSDGTIRYAD